MEGKSSLKGQKKYILNGFYIIDRIDRNFLPRNVFG